MGNCCSPTKQGKANTSVVISGKSITVAEIASAEKISEDQVKQLLQVFKTFDKNRDGKITAEEFEEALLSMNKRMKSSRINKFFRHFAKDGCVEFSDFVTLMVQKIPEESEHDANLVFQTFDKDQDGFITEQDLREGLALLGIKVTDKDVHKMMEEGDKDKDGKISKEGKKSEVKRPCDSYSKNSRLWAQFEENFFSFQPC